MNPYILKSPMDVIMIVVIAWFTVKASRMIAQHMPSLSFLKI